MRKINARINKSHDHTLSVKIQIRLPANLHHAGSLQCFISHKPIYVWHGAVAKLIDRLTVNPVFLSVYNRSTAADPAVTRGLVSLHQRLFSDI